MSCAFTVTNSSNADDSQFCSFSYASANVTISIVYTQLSHIPHIKNWTWILPTSRLDHLSWLKFKISFFFFWDKKVPLECQHWCLCSLFTANALGCHDYSTIKLSLYHAHLSILPLLPLQPEPASSHASISKIIFNMIFHLIKYHWSLLSNFLITTRMIFWKC